MVTVIFSAPATWFAMLVVALGAFISWIRMRGFRLFGGGWLNPLVETSFGFDTLNRMIAAGVQKLAGQLSFTQTGVLSWNVVGILGAFLAVLIFLVWSA
jgi:hypothetical protein